MKLKIILFAITFTFAINLKAQTGVPNTNWYTNQPSAQTFYIQSADELAGLAKLVNGDGISPVTFYNRTIILSADIDLGGENGAYGISYNNGNGWIPIGYFTIEGKDFENFDISTLTNLVNSNDRPFRGTLNGNGKTVSGLYINDAGLITAGLFGFVYDGGLVNNLKIDNVNITGGGYAVGGITGILAGSTSIIGGSNARITNSWVAGNLGGAEGITGFISGIGGISGVSVGIMTAATISRCYTDLNIEGAGTAGGITGIAVSALGQANIENCYTLGNTGGAANVGGIVGTTLSVLTATVTINRSYAIGAVSGIGNVGGIAGMTGTNCNINNSAALNISISAAGEAGRVTGNNAGTLSNNIAFDEIKDVDGNIFTTTAVGASAIDGLSITAMQIFADGTLGGRFAVSAWITQNGFLPGFENPVPMPRHLNPAYNLTNAAITLTQNEYFYDGTPKTPEVTVVAFGGTTLEPDNDYIINFSDNINAGTEATVVITGAGEYWGEKTIMFTIHKVNISTAEITLTPNIFTYNGNPAEPTAIVVLDEKTLTPQTDYQINYENNIFAGNSAKAIITGVVNYFGEVEIEFTIEKADPSYTIETGLTAVYGQFLSEIEFQDERWSWINPESSVGDAGMQTHKAEFTPDDTDNYNIISNIDVPILVSKAPQSLTAVNISCFVDDDNIDLFGHAESSAGTDGGNIIYIVSVAGTTGAVIMGTILSFEAAGTALLIASTSGNNNYSAAMTTFTLTVSNNNSIDEISKANKIKTFANNGILYVTGLTVGEKLTIYSMNGVLVHQKTVENSEEQIPLKVQGVYIIDVEGKREMVLSIDKN